MFFMDATLPEPPRRPLSKRGGASNGEPAIAFSPFQTRHALLFPPLKKGGRGDLLLLFRRKQQQQQQRQKQKQIPRDRYAIPAPFFKGGELQKRRQVAWIRRTT